VSQGNGGGENHRAFAMHEKIRKREIFRVLEKKGGGGRRLKPKGKRCREKLSIRSSQREEREKLAGRFSPRGKGEYGGKGDS